MMCGAAISWNSKKQMCVALSTAEAGVNMVTASSAGYERKLCGSNDNF